MIKINLLPKTINQKVILHNTMLAFGVALIVIIIGGIAYGSSIKSQVEQKQTEAVAAEAFKAKVEAIQKQGTDLLASIGPMKKKLDFINSVLEYNKKYPALYAEVARWTYKNVEYTSLLCNGMKVDITGKAKNLDEFGRYLLNLYRAGDLYSEVSVVSAGQLSGTAAAGSVPYQGASGGNANRGTVAPQAGGYHPGWLDFSISCKLNPKKTITQPTFAGAVTQPTTGAVAGPETPTLPVLPAQDKKPGR